MKNTRWLNNRNGRFLRVLAVLIGCFPAGFRLGAADSVPPATYTIVTDAQAIPAEKTAAGELQHYLNKIYGYQPEIRQAPGSGRNIYVGRSPAVCRLLPEIDWDHLKPDEIIIRTLNNGDLILSGDRPRGTLYAVDTFLEDGLGVRWWTPDAEFVPHLQGILPEMNRRYAPPFATREVSFTDISFNPTFASRMKINGTTCWFSTKRPAELGGNMDVLGIGHTFGNLLLPASKYFKIHPEWYSEIGGKRIDSGQLCLTNPEMKQALIESAVNVLRAHPENHTISISQNDNCNYCRCSACTARTKQLGNQTDLLIDFLNDAGEQLSHEFPDVIIETFAYQYTRKPPKTVKPSNRLIIRLCTIEANFAQPLDSKSNADFSADLKNWNKKASQLAVWNYAVNFMNYPLPHPNFSGFAEDLRFFAANRVTSVYEQGDAGGGSAGDFSALRAWLLSHLLWNPQADQQKLTLEFLQGYYGKAAPYLEKYLALRQQSMAAHPEQKLKLYMEDTSTWLPFSKLQECRELLDQAMSATKDTPEINRRVALVSQGVDWALLWRVEFTPWGKVFAPKMRFDRKELSQLFDVTTAALTKAARTDPKYGWLREGCPADRMEKKLNVRLSLGEKVSTDKLPDFLAHAAPDRCIILGPDSFGRLGGNVHKVLDKAAAGEQVLSMDSDTAAWDVQMFLPDLPQDIGIWRIYAEVRGEARESTLPTGEAISGGVWDANDYKGTRTGVPAKDVCKPQYTFIPIGEVRLGPLPNYWKVIYLAPVINPTMKRVFFNRLAFLKMPQK